MASSLRGVLDDLAARMALARKKPCDEAVSTHEFA
jgi:hypothetical protein